MNKVNQICHLDDQRKVGVHSQSMGRPVSPLNKANLQSSGFRGIGINDGISTEECFPMVGSKCVEGQIGYDWVGFAGSLWHAAQNSIEVDVQAKVAENFLAKELGLVGADCHGNPYVSEHPEGVTHPGKREGRGRWDRAVPGPELFKVGSRISGKSGHDRFNHGYAANGVHGLDQVAISRLFRPAFSQHLVDDLSGELSAVYQCAVEIKNDTAVNHKPHLNRTGDPAVARIV